MNGSCNLVVESIGSASPRVVQALRHGLQIPEFELVRRLYQAPSVLLTGVPETTARGIGELLTHTGLETRIADADEVFSAGKGDHDVALHVRNPSRLREVITEISNFLGCDGATAAQIAWSAPSALVGSVSRATVDALSRRFAPLEVEVDASVSESARYDLFAQDVPAPLRMEMDRVLKAQGFKVEPTGALVAAGLTRPAADALWQRFEQRVKMRLLDRAFQRFDVRLDRATESPALLATLVRETGMPAAAAPKVLRRLPIVLHGGVRYAELAERMGPLVEAGATVSAHLLTLQSYNLVIESVRDTRLAAKLLSTLTGSKEEEQHRSLRRLPLRLEGPFTTVKARWMRDELKAADAVVRLEER